MSETAKCEDCGLDYADPGFCDLVIPDAVFRQISTAGDGNGLFCPTCMCRRAAKAGLDGVPAEFRSGPFAKPEARQHPQPANDEDDIEDDIRAALEVIDEPDVATWEELKSRLDL